MTENRPSDYLDHMRQAAANACAFVEGPASTATPRPSIA
ncbi:hypothetical protein TVNIR_3299 [Thioalkalivibrio nitratireducens DSM 14787]|uniref:Uncharacterized protein n=1 Tax=Thioalkalivibrio nitratireducens (strain DSM 14787 / UNIQEM 213 / ALEN2) TaxID=1255043 RepID=L0E2T6_THIND|nr:hypothetical protein TVNIR_3299 [Thioalkalivibrio nitratireducens DSM 14787]